MRVGGFVVGVLALSALEVVTSSSAAADRASAIPSAAAGLVDRIFSPDIALLPNWHDSKAPAHTPPASATTPVPLIDLAGRAAPKSGTAAGLRAAHGG